MFKIKNTIDNQLTIWSVMRDNAGVILNKEISGDYIIFDILNQDPMFAVRFSNGSVIKTWLDILET